MNDSTQCFYYDFVTFIATDDPKRLPALVAPITERLDGLKKSTEYRFKVSFLDVLPQGFTPVVFRLYADSDSPTFLEDTSRLFFVAEKLSLVLKGQGIILFKDI